MKTPVFSKLELYAMAALVVFSFLRPGYWLAAQTMELPGWWMVAVGATGAAGIVTLFITFPLLFIWSLFQSLDAYYFEAIGIALYAIFGVFLMRSKTYLNYVRHTSKYAYIAYFTGFSLFQLLYDFSAGVHTNRLAANLSKPDAFDGMATMMYYSFAMFFTLLVSAELTSRRNKKALVK